jgi:hypothetical protein
MGQLDSRLVQPPTQRRGQQRGARVEHYLRRAVRLDTTTFHHVILYSQNTHSIDDSPDGPCNSIE